MVRAAYLAMSVITWFVILPLSLASLLSGIVQSLLTPWGLIRHYWVVTKLGLTIVCTAVLLQKMKLIGQVAESAYRTELTASDLLPGRMELLVHAGGGLLQLLVITVLSVFKPWGRTGYGSRKLQKEREKSPGPL
jgi:hypothetical protein